MTARVIAAPLTLTLASLVVASCTESRRVGVTFGAEGEGLDGFMCRDKAGSELLDRLVDPSGAVRPANLVVDLIRLGGVPGCRSGQLVKWCAVHECSAIASSRSCVTVNLPADVSTLERPDLRARILDSLRAVSGHSIVEDAPGEFLLLRIIGTAQSCDEMMTSADEIPLFDPEQLVGCAYSCPVLIDEVEQDVYLGFETLTAQCEQGVRLCAAQDLHWQP